ncbi:uncharacterized protein BJ212DRAFT_1305652 [Suillus subaureus]|uniref:Uncharacterized protein n=1 Tax=Suillus subaureus TaxID=48587 RepID=A0A9P7DMZ3_9AGAM|nr:uncharacterized protein BJ212DRAFT_1305652 [Suillus subaureus]KAG1798793.1 hypothetical protein BJ212DRAFT_1305652 [Suillus subaureus]
MANLLDDARGIFHKHPNLLALYHNLNPMLNQSVINFQTEVTVKPPTLTTLCKHEMSLLPDPVDSEDIGQGSWVTTEPTPAAATTTTAPIVATPTDATSIIATPIIVTPIVAAVSPIAATVAPIAAAVALNATMLQHPQRQWQLPLRYHDNSPVRTGHMPYDGEYIDIDNVSGGEEDDLPAPRVRAPPVPSPMQTAASTIYSTQVDPLAMGA